MSKVASSFMAFATALAIVTCLPKVNGARTGASDIRPGIPIAEGMVPVYVSETAEFAEDELKEHSGVTSEWLWRTNETIQYTHMSMLENLPDNRLAAAWQASQLHEGQCCASLGQVQSLWFSLSRDGGQTWGSPSIAVAGMTPSWGPVLHYEASEKKLWLFYSLSMISASPGGDLVYRTTTDLDSDSPKWSAPTVLWRSEDAEGHPKVTANKIAVLSNGDWVLPTWQESHLHHKTGVASVLIGRRDKTGHDGRSWEVQGHLSSTKAGWLIEGTVAEVGETNGDRTVVQLFRTMDKRIWSARSSDGGLTWSEAAEIPELMNPNSKVSITSVTDSKGQQGLVLAYNPSERFRTPLALAHSRDGRSWTDFAIIENDIDNPGRLYAYPTVIQHKNDLLVSYSVYGGRSTAEADEMIASAYPLPVPEFSASIKWAGMKVARLEMPDF